jgi:hypothetical protein
MAVRGVHATPRAEAHGHGTLDRESDAAMSHAYSASPPKDDSRGSARVPSRDPSLPSACTRRLPVGPTRESWPPRHSMCLQLAVSIVPGRTDRRDRTFRRLLPSPLCDFAEEDSQGVRRLSCPFGGGCSPPRLCS